MRIIAGKLKGRKLVAPSLSSVRPASERVRESIFSSLESMRSFCGLKVLDLFAGSGAVAMEALSRGAEQAILVELDKRVVSVIRENIQTLSLSSVCSVVHSDVMKFVGRRNDFGYFFDLVFVDPPYDLLVDEWIFKSLVERNWVQNGSMLVYERRTKSAGEMSNSSNEYAKMLKEKRYGGTLVQFFEFYHEDCGIKRNDG